MVESLNKGEWSEFYAFIKILGDRVLVAANVDLTPDPEISYGVLKILRNDATTSRTYDLSGDEKITLTTRSLEGRNTKTVPYEKIRCLAPRLFTEITAGIGASFEVHSAGELISILKCGKVKAAPNTKGDITIVVHDYVTNKENKIEFSIKSYLGSAPTLLNASRATNFKFRIENFAGDFETVNAISGGRKVRKRMQAVKNACGTMKLNSLTNQIFKRNLRKIDSSMPLFLGDYLLLFYSGEGRTLEELTHLVADNESAVDSLGEPFNYEDLKYKMKQLLINVALGMVPASDWSGFIKADGGYIIVKEGGDVVCFHIYNISELGEYLFYNTKLETASTNRHDFASLYQEDGDLFMNLNFSIRFI